MNKEIKIALANSILISLWMKGLLSDEDLKNAKEKVALTLSL